MFDPQHNCDQLVMLSSASAVSVHSKTILLCFTVTHVSSIMSTEERKRKKERKTEGKKERKKERKKEKKKKKKKKKTWRKKNVWLCTAS